MPRMRASLWRSHAREAMAASETRMTQSIELWRAAGRPSAVRTQLNHAAAAHALALASHDDTDYGGVLSRAMEALSATDAALTALGQPDVIHDPMAIGADMLLPCVDAPPTANAVQSAVSD